MGGSLAGRRTGRLRSEWRSRRRQGTEERQRAHLLRPIKSRNMPMLCRVVWERARPLPTFRRVNRSWLCPACVDHCASRLLATPAGSLRWRTRAALLALPPGLAASGPGQPLALLQARAEAALMRTFRRERGRGRHV
ncbi:hypothetical protein TSOC_011476 [Tetrabaena socialis]|uniref:Uncharacterized protein n=1 Tax=Tetrabaena socialis TaxID=47790 RepID=A0A2J7ZQJ4_9CHLO|nr:hypothetical protein TSOC_011476 [Tetrabaena socialis]|eukprot:PNH02537.1 hypothetical protein TSOC_011476 [Tetrabaena socialis]